VPGENQDSTTFQGRYPIPKFRVIEIPAAAKQQPQPYIDAAHSRRFHLSSILVANWVCRMHPNCIQFL
jgi:hypothetical protein